MFFRKTWAFFKRDLIEYFSYKASFVFELVGIFSNILTFFFIAKVFGAGASPYLQNYGGDYFSFVLIGIAFASYQSVALNSFSGALQKEQGAGTLEAILMTPTRLSTVILSTTLLSFVFATLRVLFYLFVGAAFFGLNLSRVNFVSALATLFLTLTSLSGLGIFSAGFLLVFKKGDPVNYFMGGISKFLAGVYFPISILPLWVQNFSSWIPLTHSLTAMRQALLAGASCLVLKQELLALAAFSIVLLPLGIFFFGWALRRAKRDGSLVFC